MLRMCTAHLIADEPTNYIQAQAAMTLPEERNAAATPG